MTAGSNPAAPAIFFRTGFSPPLGLNAYVTAAQTGVPLREVFRSLLPFILMELVILGLLIAFPDITLTMPEMMAR